MNNQEIKDRNKIIREGINDFLDDHGINLSSQNMARTAKRLFKTFEQDNSISATSINDFLSRIFEYNEGAISSMNSEDGSDYEELLVSLVISAEKKTKIPAKIWLIVLLCLSLLVGLVISFSPPPLNPKISITLAKELKDLVAQIVNTEDDNGNQISHTSVWNAVKRAASVIRYGTVHSYKDFSEAQYIEASTYLTGWPSKIRNGDAYLKKGKAIKVTFQGMKIKDGDTFSYNDVTYRLWGVDAFEMKQECLDANNNLYMCGVKSKDALVHFMSNAKEIVCYEMSTDRYKRTIVKCDIDSEELGGMLVQSGYALDYTKYSGGHFKDFEHISQNDNTGAWDGCFIKPWDYRHKENLDICN